MAAIDEIQRVLDGLKISTAGTIVRDSRSGDHYFVVVPVSRDHENRQSPSNRLLGEARSQLEALGIGVEFLLTDAHAQDVEAGLRATLLHTFSGSIRNVFASIASGKAAVWLEPKHELDAKALADMKKRVAEFLDEVGIRLESVTTTVDERLPSVFLCLKVIRQLAPVAPTTLVEHLKKLGFVIPSDDWLSRRLDGMRRTGRLIRQADGRYSLSLAALRALGTVKGRQSPDIARLLALSRRGL
jgi:hypothetical protein